MCVEAIVYYISLVFLRHNARKQVFTADNPYRCEGSCTPVYDLVISAFALFNSRNKNKNKIIQQAMKVETANKQKVEAFISRHKVNCCISAVVHYSYVVKLIYSIRALL